MRAGAKVEGWAQIFRGVREICCKRLLDKSFLCVCLPARIEELGYHWTDMREV